MNKPETRRYVRLVPETFAVMLWEMGLDTAQIASRTGCRESDVYNALSKWRETKHDPHHPALPAVREQALESQ
jgi:hypothetical protein